MKRLKNESFAAYKRRRKEEYRQLKKYLKGRLFHNSSKDGTYYCDETKRDIKRAKEIKS